MSKEIEILCEKIKMKYLHKGNDFILLIFGKEGSGKSNCAFCFAQAMDKNFSVDNVVFSKEEHNRIQETLPPEATLLGDEGSNIVCKSDTLQREQINTIKKITTGRDLRLFRIYVMSDPNMLHNYFVRHRMNEDGIAVIKIISRGKFLWFPEKSGVIRKMREMLLSKSKEFDWEKIKSYGIEGKFEHYEKIHPEFSKKYREKKKIARVTIDKPITRSERRVQKAIVKLDENGWNIKEIANLLGVTKSYVYIVLKQKSLGLLKE